MGLVNADGPETLKVEIQEVVGFESVDGDGVDFLHGEQTSFVLDSIRKIVKASFIKSIIVLRVFLSFQPLECVLSCETHS